MYTRVVRLTDIDPDHLPERVAETETETETREGPPGGIAAKTIQILHDADQRTAVVIQLLETADDMAASAGAPDAMDSGDTPRTRLGRPLRDQAELSMGLMHRLDSAAVASADVMARAEPSGYSGHKRLTGGSEMWGSFGAKLGVLALTTLVIGLAACGDSDDETPAENAVTTGTHRATAGLERFLLARGEEPGYQPSGPVEKLSSAEEFAARGPRPEADARRLRDEGFVSFVRRELEGKEGPGVTSLLLFRSAAGAKREAAAERRNVEVEFRGRPLKRFDVPGVPGAFGWTATTPDGHRVGNVTWVEGRCVMTLGNAEASSFVAPLTAGVQAVHRRVAGRCP